MEPYYTHHIEGVSVAVLWTVIAIVLLYLWCTNYVEDDDLDNTD